MRSIFSSTPHVGQPLSRVRSSICYCVTTFGHHFGSWALPGSLDSGGEAPGQLLNPPWTLDLQGRPVSHWRFWRTWPTLLTGTCQYLCCLQPQSITSPRKEAGSGRLEELHQPFDGKGAKSEGLQGSCNSRQLQKDPLLVPPPLDGLAPPIHVEGGP